MNPMIPFTPPRPMPINPSMPPHRPILAPHLYPERCKEHKIGEVIMVAQGCPEHQVDGAEVAGITLCAVIFVLMLLAVFERWLDRHMKA